MVLVTCPTCNRRFRPAESSAMPFCGDRCRRIDLNRWLSEEISLPYRDEDDGEDPGPRDEPADWL